MAKAEFTVTEHYLNLQIERVVPYYHCGYSCICTKAFALNVITAGCPLEIKSFTEYGSNWYAKISCAYAKEQV